ncbi:N-acetyltransferase family protein [Aquihabitans sp. McL0605]|uniref:GNAT family N-acetyltransferase n=1 Tax=Aquihabitans sp. McL0605 TaxID=3415671 RepID=UPI003CF72B6B
MTAADGALVRRLAWESGFWGRPMVEVLGTTADAVTAADHWCRTDDVAMAHLRLPAGEVGVVGHAARLGFEVLEVNVVVDRRLGGDEEPVAGLRPATAADGERLAAIARTDLRGMTRFYRDPRFPTDRCDDLYAGWVESSIDGWADVVLVAERDGEVVGGVTGHHGSGGEPSRVGLLVIDGADPWRRVNVGNRLLRGVFQQLGASGGREVTLATQAHNVATVRLLERLGCSTRSISLQMHKWYDDPPPPEP